MNLFEFNTDKMSWEKVSFGNVNFALTGVRIKITDENYFNEIKHILLNLRNINSRLILINHTKKNTYYLDNLRLANVDVINDSKITANKDTLFISTYINEATNSLTDINNYWLYLQYE